MKIQILSALSLAVFLAGCYSTPSKTTATTAMDITSVSQTTEKQGLKLAVQAYTRDQSDYQNSLYDLTKTESMMPWCC